MDHVFLDYCSSGNLDVVIKNYPTYSDNLYIMSCGFTSSCINGHLHIAQWLLETGNLNANFNAEPILRNTCKGGHLATIIWLFEILSSDSILDCLDDCFEISCSHGHLDLAKWLSNNVPAHSQINTNIFYKIAYNGHPDVCRWLLETYPETDIDGLACSFRLCCENGYFDIAQWLWNYCQKIAEEPQNIDIFDNWYSGFAKCTNVPLLEWLQTISRHTSTPLYYHNGIKYIINVEDPGCDGCMPFLHQAGVNGFTIYSDHVADLSAVKHYMENIKVPKSARCY